MRNPWVHKKTGEIETDLWDKNITNYELKSVLEFKNKTNNQKKFWDRYCGSSK